MEKTTKQTALEELEQFYAERKKGIENRRKQHRETREQKTENSSSDQWENVWNLICDADSCTTFPRDRMKQVIQSLATDHFQIQPKASSMSQFSFPLTIQEVPPQDENKRNKSSPTKNSSETPPITTAESPQNPEIKVKQEKQELEQTKINEIETKIDSQASESKEVDVAPTEPLEATSTDRELLTENSVESTEASKSEDSNVKFVEENKDEAEDFFGNFSSTESSWPESGEAAFAEFPTENIEFSTPSETSFTADFGDFGFSTPTSNELGNDFGDFSKPVEQAGEDFGFFESAASTTKDFSVEDEEEYSYGKSYGDSSDSDDDYGYGGSYGKGGYGDDDDDLDAHEVSGDEILDKICEDSENGGNKLLQCIQDSNEKILEIIQSSEKHLEQIKTIVRSAKHPTTNQSALHLSVLSNSLAWFEFALECDCTESTDHDQNTPLHLAAALGRMEMLSPLLQRKFTISALNNNSRTPLHMAAINGQMNAIISLVACGGDVLAGDKDGLTALHFACFRSSKAVSSYLIDFCKELVDVKDYKGRTPLHAAAHAVNTEICQTLLNAGANIHEKDFNGKSALLWCLSQSSNIAGSDVVIHHCMKFLVNKGCSINDRDSQKRNALHYASYFALPKCLKYIFSKSKDLVNSEDYQKQTPLFSAVASNMDDFRTKEIVETLLHAGANPFHYCSQGKIPIHVAISMNEYLTAQTLWEKMKQICLDNEVAPTNKISLEDIVDGQKKSLLQNCAETAMHQLAVDIFKTSAVGFESLVDHKDKYGNGLLHSISQGGSMEMLDYLSKSIDRELFVDKLVQVNKLKRNILHIAAGVDHIEFIQEVLRIVNDFDICERLLTAQDAYGITPIHYAALRGSYCTLDFFVNANKKLAFCLTRKNQTVLHAAIAGSAKLICVSLLIDAGVDVNAKDSLGRTPIFYIVRENGKSRLDILQMLVGEYNADTSIIDEDGQSFIAVASAAADCQEIIQVIDKYE